MYTYQNQQKYIQELRMSRDKKKMAELSVKMAKQINQRFYRLENKGIGTQEAAYKYAMQETGKKKPRYSVNLQKLENMEINELFENLMQINMKLISNTSTIKGLQIIEDNRLSGAIKALNDAGIEDIDAKDFKDFLKMGGGDLLNSRFYDSEQIVEDWKTYTQGTNVSNKEFLREFKRYKKQKSADYGKITRNLKKLKKRKAR